MTLRSNSTKGLIENHNKPYPSSNSNPSYAPSSILNTLAISILVFIMITSIYLTNTPILVFKSNWKVVIY